MRLLDRYIIKSYLINYLLALAVMVGMYTLLDLIVNFENFTKGATNPQQVATIKSILADMADYYMYQMLVIFQMVSGAIPLMAAGFTMVRMTRHRELTAMLASGVSLYRVAAPIVAVAICFSLLNVVNQEFVISQPAIIEKLLRKHDEVSQPITRNGRIDMVVDTDEKTGNSDVLTANQYEPTKRKMTGVLIVQRNKQGLQTHHMIAEWAQWKAPDDGNGPEAWELHNVISEDDGPVEDPRDRLTVPPTPKFTYHSRLTPAQLDLIFQRKAVDFLSSRQLAELIEFSPGQNKPLLSKMMHLRWTQPIMNVVMLLIGIPYLLTREPGKLIMNMMKCTLVTGVVFIGTFVIFQLKETQVDPLLAAWLPVLGFGPLAFVMLDMIET